MKKITKLFSILSLFLLVGVAAPLISSNKVSNVSAASDIPYPGNGRSGTLMFVNGKGEFFVRGVANLAIICKDSNGREAWSEQSDYRISGDDIRVVLPYYNGQGVTWSHFKICRYNPNMNPQTDGYSGCYNTSDWVGFSVMSPRGQNTMRVDGYDNDYLVISPFMDQNRSWGIAPDSHIYLDLSRFTGWENDEAKFAFYFACPEFNNSNAWGQSYYDGTYYTSFCWKVNGQDNPHLYECVVPSVNNNKLWNLVIALRFSKDTVSPSFESAWNTTGNLTFVKDTSESNIIAVTDWNSGEIDAENIITKASRLDFYGQYFMDTVVCSGSGDKDSTTEEMWNKVRYEYEHQLSRTYQGDIWTTVADKSTTASRIAQAMARYDYIVLYKTEYGHYDFINRKESPNKTVYEARLYLTEFANEDNVIIPILIIASISVLSLATLILIKKKKYNKK